MNVCQAMMETMTTMTATTTKMSNCIKGIPLTFEILAIVGQMARS